MKKEKKELELLPSKKHKDRADIISCNPREDTVKIRAKRNGKETTKTLAIKLEKIKKQKKTIEEIESKGKKPRKKKEKKPKKR